MNLEKEINAPNFIHAERELRRALNVEEEGGYPFLSETFSFFMLSPPWTDITARRYVDRLFTRYYVSDPENALTVSAMLVECLLYLRRNKDRTKDINNYCIDIKEELPKLDSIMQRQDQIITQLNTLNQTVDRFQLIVDQLNDVYSNFSAVFQRFEDFCSSVGDSLGQLLSAIDELIPIVATVTETSRQLVDKAVRIENIVTNLNDYFSNIQSLLTQIKNRVDSLPDNLSLQISNTLNNFTNNIKNTIDLSIQDSIQTFYNNFKRTEFLTLRTAYWNELNTRLTNNAQSIVDTIRGLDSFVTLSQISISNTSILAACAALSVKLDTALGTLQTILPSLAIIGAETTTSATNSILIKTQTQSIQTDTTNIYNLFSSFQPSFYDFLNDRLNPSPLNLEDGLNQYSIKHHDEIIKIIGDGVLSVATSQSNFTNQPTINQSLPPNVAETISDLVALKICGESYSKWNSTSSFYPTITFIMKEVTLHSEPRRAQIKLRYIKAPDDIQDNDIEFLKIQCQELKDFSYSYGTLRANFVSKNKQVKTTIFAASKEDADKALSTFCSIVLQDWSPSDVTYTEGAKRLPITRKSTPL